MQKEELIEWFVNLSYVDMLSILYGGELLMNANMQENAKVEINDYGVRINKQFVETNCWECGAICTPKYVIAIMGNTDLSLFCSTKCLVKHYMEEFWEDTQ